MRIGAPAAEEDGVKHRTGSRARTAAKALAIASTFASAASPALEALGPAPVVLNRREVAVPLVQKLFAAGLVPDGTLFVAVHVNDDGTLVPGAAYGILNGNADVERAVRAATAAIQVSTPPEWLAANPERRWAVFWMFQNDGCRSPIYAAPNGVVSARVCLLLDGRKLDRDGSIVNFGFADGDSTGPEYPRVRFGGRTALTWPDGARARGIDGRAVVRAIIGPQDKSARTEVVSSSPDASFAAAAEAFIRRAGIDRGPGEPVATERVQTLSFQFLHSPCISVPEAGWSVSVCAGRGSR